MKVIIAGGGTGGHLFPGIAIAREILKDKESEVLFIGTAQGIEARVLPAENLPVRFISAGKLKGMGAASILKTMVKLPQSLFQSVAILKRMRPDVVIGVGGYSSGPVALAAWFMRKPLLIVEPNSYAGMANRMAGKLADKILLTFPATDRQGFFPKHKTVKTGALVRKGIDQGNREQALRNFSLDDDRFTLFAMGGSGGAHAINKALIRAARYLKAMPKFQILHQTGEKDADEVKKGYHEAGVKATVLPFIKDMAGAYAAADLVVARSGATTVAELSVCGKRAILIPFPFAADNHQEYNARSLAERGIAEVIVQKDLEPEELAIRIKKYADSGAAPVPGASITAAEEIAEICKGYVQKN